MTSWADEAVGPQGPAGPTGSAGATGGTGPAGPPGWTELEDQYQSTGLYPIAASGESLIVSLSGAPAAGIVRYLVWVRATISSSNWAAGTERIRLRVRVNTVAGTAGSRTADALLSPYISSASEDSMSFITSFHASPGEQSAARLYVMLTGERAAGTGNCAVTATAARPLGMGFGPITALAVSGS